MSLTMKMPPVTQYVGAQQESKLWNELLHAICSLCQPGFEVSIRRAGEDKQQL